MISISSSKDHSLSHWQEKNPYHPISADLPLRADVAIIGGGLLGAATCYWLTKQGIAPMLIERTTPAYGATGRNGGFVSIGPAENYADACARLGQEIARSILDVTRANQKLLQQLLVEENIDCDYRKSGSIDLVLNEEQWEHFVREEHVSQSSDIQTMLLDRTQLQDMIKTTLSEEILGGRMSPEDALIDPVKLVRGLLEASQRGGARICQATVTQLEPAHGYTRIHTTQGTLSADRVLVATNAWISELFPFFSQVIIPVRGQMLSYDPLPTVFPTGMAASLTPTHEYWQQTLDGTIVLGGCRAIAFDGDVGVRESEPTKDVQDALEQVLPRLFPSLSPLYVKQRWAGLMAFTPDYVPIVDHALGTENIWVGGGFSGHGMPFGIKLGQLLAQELISQKSSIDLRPFRLDRPGLQIPHQ